MGILNSLGFGMDMKFSITWLRLLRSAQRPISRPVADFRPRKLKQWIAQLPLGNIGETSRLLYGVLGELNDARLNPTMRFENLELLRPAVDHACTALRKHFLGISLPLPEKQRMIARLEQTLNLQLAEGYRLVARALESRRRRGFGKSLLAASLSRALESSAQALINAYQVYAPLPEDLWQAVHWCFRTAARHRVQGRPVHGGREEGVATSTVDIYKRLLLLDAADPYRLRQGEVEIVYAAAGSWTSMVHVHAATGARRERGKIYVNFDVDAPPSSRAQGELAATQAHAVVDLSLLAACLREELSGGRHALRRHKSMGSDLTRRLLLAWASQSRRRKARARQSKTVNVAIGLRAIHHFLSVSESLQPPIPNRPVPEAGHNGADAKAVLALATNSGQWTFGEQAMEIEHVELTQTAAWGAVNMQLSLQPWRTLNVSHGGYGLLWDKDTPSKAHVGELVGILDAGQGNEEQWLLGVIRRMRSLPRLGLEVGVEILATAPLPVSFSAIQADGSMGVATDGLLLPESTDHGRPAALIAPLLSCRGGERVAITHGREQTAARLVRLITASGAFVQLEMRALPGARAPAERPAPAPPPAIESAAGPPAPREFDNLWDEL